LENLKERLARIVIGCTYEQKPITVRDIQIEGALTLLLKDAIKPNLVQTTENTQAIVHGGPFPNNAHDSNGITATKTAAKPGDNGVTEAGFVADLGAEKFLNIKARAGQLKTDAVVIVATVRALKMHGGAHRNRLSEENLPALEAGMENLAKHIESIDYF